MNEHDKKQLAVFRSFFARSSRHGSRMTEGRSSISAAERGQIEVERARDEFVLAFGNLPDDETIRTHAESKWRDRNPDRAFDELSENSRASWIRSSKLELATFDVSLYRRLADATARETIGVGLDDIRSDNIREGWVRAAEIALHVPPRFWDEQYLIQNACGLRKMLSESQTETIAE